MKRYQILYNKAGFPLCVWKPSEEEARSFANRFRASGYSVDVWEHTETGAQNQHLTPPDDGPRKRPKPPGSQPGKVAGTIPQRGAQSMDKVKFFNQQLNGQIVMAELEAEHLAKSIRLLSEGDDYVAWAGEVANYATTLNQLAEVLTALRKVARDSEILMEREEKA